MSVEESGRATARPGYDEQTLAGLQADAAQVVARYPDPRSALLPLLHLVQSVDGYVSPAGIGFCARTLDLSVAQVSAVATFYTQFKRRPNGRYTVGVCTNPLCGVMGGDAIWEELTDHLGIGHDETTADGAITLEQIECNAACDYAPVMMVNWEFFDQQTPASAVDVVDRLLRGEPVAPTRGADRVATFTQMSRVLAGFPDGHADEGTTAGEPTLRGLRLAHDRGWTAPAADAAANTDEATAGTEGTASTEATASTAQPAAGAAGDSVPAVGGPQSSAERTAQTPADVSPKDEQRKQTGDRAREHDTTKPQEA